MAKQPSLPKSELEVARIVWELGKATVRQVADALPEDRNLDFFTVQTYLRRLEAKGYLRKRREGRNNIYFPRARPSRVVRDVVDDFIHRMFDGEAMPLFQHIIHQRGLTDEEIEQLRQTLNHLKERKR
jgi:BlaI family penicillinase repressor